MEVQEVTMVQAPQNNTWTPKKIIATAAGILALLGGGGGLYGALGSGDSGHAQVEKDKAQDARIDRCESKIEQVYSEVVKNGKGIERLLERTKTNNLR